MVKLQKIAKMRFLIMNIVIVSLFIAGSLMNATPAYAQNEGRITLLVGHDLSEDDLLLKLFLRRWAQYFYEATDKKVNLVLQGPETRLAEKKKGKKGKTLHELLVKGEVDIAFVNLFNTKNDAFFYSKLFALPFLATDSEIASLAFWEIANQYLPVEYEKLQLLSTHIDPYGIIHYGNRPLTTLTDHPIEAIILPDDLKGRIIVTRNPHAQQFIRFMKGTALDIPQSSHESARLFTRGNVDAFLLNWSGLKSQDLNLLDRHTLIQGLGTPYYFAVNREKFDLLPKHWQKILKTRLGGEKLVKFAAQVTEHIHSQESTSLRRKGNVVFIPNSQQRHLWRGAGNDYIDDFFNQPENIDNKAMAVIYNLMREKMAKIQTAKARQKQ